MKLFLLLINIVLLNLTLLAQENIFIYQKQDDGVITFKSDTVTIIFNQAVKTKSSSVERVVMANNRYYNFIVKKTTSGKVLEIRDSAGTLRATEFLFGDQKYTLLLSNGEVLKWKENRTHWSYQRNGQYVLESTYLKVEDEKQVILHGSDPSFPVTEIMQIAFLERASQNMVSSSRSTEAMIGIAIGLALFRIGASGSH